MIDSMVDSLIGSASQKRVHSKPQKRVHSKPQKRVHSKYRNWEYSRFWNDTNIGYIATSKDYWGIRLDRLVALDLDPLCLFK